MPSFAQQLKDVREKRVKLVADARTLTDLAYAEKRELSKEEDERFSRMMGDVDNMKERMDKLEKMSAAEDEDRADDPEVDEDRDAEETQEAEEDMHDEDEDAMTRARKPKGARRSKTAPGGVKPAANTKMPWETQHEFRNRQRRSTVEYRKVFNHYLVDGVQALNTPLARRAIAADTDIVGGYLVAPQEFVGQLIKFVDNILWLRQLATKYTVKAAQSLGAPSLDTDIADADWTSELDTGNEDTSMAFGKRELSPKPLAKRIKISNKLLRMASLSGGFSADGSVSGGGPEGIVRARLGYKFGVSQEKAFMTGTGSNQPLGIFTASARGVSTSRDYSTGMLTTNFTADALLGAKYAFKVQYWATLRWLFHRDALLKIRQLKDGNGQYLWVPSGMGSVAGFSEGSDTKTIGDMLLQLPVMASEYAPNTFTTGQYVGALFDPKFYWIADSEEMQIQRLVELYAASNQTGFIARQEIDAMPVLEEAFLRLKTA